MRSALIVLAILAAAIAAVPATAAAPRGFQKSFDYDTRAPLSPTATFQPDMETETVRIQKVSYLGAGGQRVPALLSIPKKGKGRRPCVFEGHGLTLTKEEGFGDNAERYGARGAAVFAIDARFHGERENAIGGEAAAAKLQTTYDLYRLTVIDMRRGLDYLGQRGLCSRIGFEGYSMGGFMGSMLIGADTRVKAGAFYVSGADWRKLFSTSDVYFGGRLTGKRLDAAVKKMAPLDPLYWIPRAKGRAVFMAAGKLDERTPLASAQALHRAAKQPKQVIVYNGGHDIEEPFRTQVFTASFKFLAKYLRFS